VKISKARIYLQGTNLFTVTDYTGLNPDIMNINPNNGQVDDRASSVDVGSYPLVKQFLVGLNLTF